VGIIGGPILIPKKCGHPFVPLYKEKSLSVVKGVRFKKNVDIVAEAVRQTMVRLGIS